MPGATITGDGLVITCRKCGSVSVKTKDGYTCPKGCGTGIKLTGDASIVIK